MFYTYIILRIVMGGVLVDKYPGPQPKVRAIFVPDAVIIIYV